MITQFLPLNTRRLAGAFAVLATMCCAAPKANAATGATIFNAWWVAADQDQDGCFAPQTANGGLRLYWDADVAGLETLMVYEKIYTRQSPGNPWQLIATNATHSITANSPADSQFIEIPSAAGCAVREYAIELYLAGTETLLDLRDPANDVDLAQHKEETYTEDLPATRIYDATWSRFVDRDGDGCVAPQTELGGIRLHWDADVPGSGSVSVFERIYVRPAAGGKWTLVSSTTPHTITGNSTADAQFLDITPTGACQVVEYKIELYRAGMDVPDYIRDGSNDADLADRKQESYLRDTGAVIADAWWSHYADVSGDGCVAPESPTGLLRLHWDPNVAGGGSLAVVERIYYAVSGTENWVLLHTTPRHTITGTVSTDAQYVDLAPGTGCEPRDYKIELYRAEAVEPDDIRDGSRDPDLAAHREQTYADDNAKAMVADAWWTDSADRDQDGCSAPATQSAYFKLSWNSDAPAGVTLQVYEKVYWRNAGGGNWTWAATTQPHTVIGKATNDVQSLSLSPGDNCAAYDYRIEVFRLAYDVADDARDASNDPDLAAHQEETWAEDNLLATISAVWWSNVVDDDADGCWAPPTTGTPVLNWNPDVVNGATLMVYDRVFRRAAGTSTWTPIIVSEPYEISGMDSNDVRSFQVPEEAACAPYEYRVELLRAASFQPDFAADPTNTPALANRKQEPKLDDAPKGFFTSVRWSGGQDHDGDGCEAPASPTQPLLLHWNADMPGASSGLFFGRVYSRPSAGGQWTLAGTTSPQALSGASTNDEQSLAIPLPGSCATLDFRVELFADGATTPDAILDASTQPLLASRKLEAYAQDNLVPAIANAWWPALADNDQDGCFAPNNRTNLVRLSWDPDISSSGTLPVFEKIYVRNTGETNWTFLMATEPHPVTGGTTNDQQFVDLPAPANCVTLDYLIEVYTAGGQVPGAVLSPATDPDLAAQKRELFEQDNTVARISNVWWSSQQDSDDDGCVSPTNATAGLRLHWDPDLTGPGNIPVFERLYRRVGDGAWALVTQSAPHLLSGNTTADALSVEIPVLNACAPVDYRIEIYRAGQTEPDATRDYSNDSALSQHSEETFAGDTEIARAVISRVWWSNFTDYDSDGCVAPAQANGYIRLNWDVDAPAGSQVQVYEKVLWREGTNQNWLAVNTTLPRTISGSNQADSVYADILPGVGCALSQYRVEVYRVGASFPDHVLDPSNTQALEQREEAASEDPGTAPAITRQPLGHTVAAGTTVTLGVAASGTAPFSYQWFFDGEALAGQTNSTLVLLKVQDSDAGNYTVRVSNAIGTRMSDAARVAIKAAAPPRLGALRLDGQGRLQFDIVGDPGVYVIEYSAGLASWKPLTTVTNTTGSVSYTDTSAPSAARFYRARAGE